MINSLEDKFQIVFCIINQPFFGWIIECHAVLEDENGRLQLQNQKIHPTTAVDFHLNEKQTQLVAWLHQIDKKNIVQKFSPKKKAIKPTEFFAKYYDAEMQKKVRPYIEKYLLKVVENLEDELIYQASPDGLTIVSKKLKFPEEPATVLFNIFKNEEDLHYFANIKYQNKRINYSQNGSILLTQEPVWMLVEDQLLFFENDLDGKKFIPFMDKKYIQIALSSEKVYLEKFIMPLVEKHDVFAKGIDIITEKIPAKPVLKITPVGKGLNLVLGFTYGNNYFNYNTTKLVNTALVQEGTNFKIKRVKRSVVWEDQKKAVLESFGFVNQGGASFGLQASKELFEDSNNSKALIQLLVEAKSSLEAAGFEIIQSANKKVYTLEEPKFNFEKTDYKDYFDVKIMISFGQFQVPFIKIRQHILSKNQEYQLPDGSIAIIPEEWFTTYLPLADFGEPIDDSVRLKKHHEALILDLEGKGTPDNYAMQKANLDFTLPKLFNATLRPYQITGFQWLVYLKSIGCGGILADDMGLGKTVQALALLAYLKEKNAETTTHLILAPTSLVYNWQKEIAIFCPHLISSLHLGSNRPKTILEIVAKNDIIITSYGTFRADIDLLSQGNFDTIIADESQSFKNKSSQLHKALKRMNANMILGLTGTPIENTVNDLWSQFDIINPKMLGSSNYFKNTFADAIEKKGDEKTAKQLQKLVAPFIMRRTKKQVLTELPAKTENTILCEMSEEQEKLYEKIKSAYRNELIEAIAKSGFETTKLKILAGLMKLRQVANHPCLAGYETVNESGKFDTICQKLTTAIATNHKILFFSQFLGQLELMKQFLDNNNVLYAYIDGSVSAKDRDVQVDYFQKNEDCKVFLLSIKAGDKGLNLTAADYVFIADPWWNPAVEAQAQDRAHRIGQEKPVFTYRFITKNSIEEKISKLQDKKKTFSDNIISESKTLKGLLSKENFELLFS